MEIFSFMKANIAKILNSKYYKYFDYIAFAVLLVLTSVASLVLFYRQAIYAPGPPWPSDIKPYIEEMLGTNTKYNFPYPVMFKLGKLINYFAPSPEWAMVIAVTLLNALAIIVVKIVLDKYTGAKLLSTISTTCLFFVSMIYGSVFERFGILNRMRGVCSPNPWHNHTFIAARPFMIVAFIFGVITLAQYEKDFAKGATNSWKQLSLYFIFAISLLLTTMTKPSYTLVHMGTFGLIMIYRLFVAKWKNFRQTILMGLFYIPTIIDLLYQYSSNFTGVASTGEEQGIGIGLFRVWSYSCHNIPLAIILGLFFPIVVLIFNWKSLKEDDIFKTSWLVLLMSFFMAAVFYEKGFREHHGNFFWGYQCGQFIVFMTSVIIILKDTLKLFNDGIRSKKTFVLLIEWCAFGIHTLMGLLYFYLLTAYGITYM